MHGVRLDRDGATVAANVALHAAHLKLLLCIRQLCS